MAHGNIITIERMFRTHLSTGAHLIRPAMKPDVSVIPSKARELGVRSHRQVLRYEQKPVPGVAWRTVRMAVPAIAASRSVIKSCLRQKTLCYVRRK
jgi:hypothetical protein